MRRTQSQCHPTTGRVAWFVEPLMKIRTAMASEAHALSKLAVAAKAHWGYSQSQLRAWTSDLTLSPDAIAQLPTFVAEVHAESGTEIAGFYQLDTLQLPWSLGHLWVKPQLMRRGLGRALLLHALARVADAGLTELCIDSDPHAEPFYVAFGAKRVGAIPAPIEDDPARMRPQLRLVLDHPTAG